jgi:hypothetical protein
MSSREVELLNNRLDLINLSIFGTANEDEQQLTKLKERLDGILNSAIKIENEIPHIVICRDLVSKLKPHLSKSKSSLAQTTERLEVALAMKAELEGVVKMLIAVQNGTESVNLPLSVDLSLYQNDLIRIENLLEHLLLLSKKQSEELDAFLSTYETAVRISNASFPISTKRMMFIL